MKKLFFTLALAAVALVSCNKDEETPAVVETNSTYVDATSQTTWHYYSLSDNKVIGTGEETVEDNAKWFARTDWDIAICRYNVRTNSGDATTANAKGGVAITTKYTLDEVTAVPADAEFNADEAVTSTGMGGITTTKIFSDATVIQFKKDAEGNSIMPPVYEQSPVYVFRTADGAANYKVIFTQYVNAESVTGHVKFNSTQL